MMVFFVFISVSAVFLAGIYVSVSFVFLAGIYAFSSNDIKVGSSIEVDGAPWRVLGNYGFFSLILFTFLFSYGIFDFF